MPESRSHKQLKRKAAGKKRQTEKKLSTGEILDAARKNTATEIEKSGTKKGLEKAVDRLKISRKKQKVLQVLNKDLSLAAKIMKEREVGGSVKNLGNTKRRSIPKKKK